jgi:hypothetical protein
VLAGVGLVLSLVALTHIALIWWPPHFGVSPWEFAAATQTVDVFPIGAAGMALLAYASMLQRWRVGAILVGAGAVLSALLAAGSALFVVLNLPVAWGSVTEGLRENLAKTGGKALLFALLFGVFYVWVAARVIRSRGKPPR